MIYLVPGAIVLALLLLAAPVSLGYDSSEPWLRIAWLGLSLRKSLGVAKPPKPLKAAPKKRVAGRALLARLWDKRELCLDLCQRAGRLALDVLKTLNFRDSAAGLSLPDPALNGLLFGVVTSLQLRNMDLSVNFENRNFAKIRVTVYPYRVAPKLTAFLLRLPYIRLVRFAWDLKKTRSKS